jgi:L-2,4-diaminobutyrate decarboxylase
MKVAASLTDALEGVGRQLERYVEESRAGRAPVVGLAPPQELARDLGLAELIEGGGLAERLEPFLERYLAHTTRMHHPGSLAHQVSVPEPLAALADLVHGVTNNAMAIYEMGPSATAVELGVLEFLLARVGWPASGDTGGSGVLTHGGSLANLTALLAARAAVATDAWDAGVPADLVVLAPRACHYSIARAASILGLGRHALRALPVDELEVARPDALPGLLRELRAEGRRVMAVVVSACATSTGLYDPLRDIGRICRDEGLWLHVDGAHGASALLSTRDRALLDGVEQADSLTWDAHKMLRAPTLCTAVLFRDARAAGQAFREEASYLFYGEGSAGVDLIHRTVECTKSALGLKAFFALALDGAAGLARYWEERCDAARRLAALVRARPSLECLCEPQANVVCFRWRAGGDGAQVAIRDALLRAGGHHLSSTEVSGRRYLRAALMNPGVDEAALAGLLDAVEQAGAAWSAARPTARTV